jgi:hypothetical protein
MELLVIEAKEDTPFVSLDSNAGVFKFSGKSYPENVHEFYERIMQYLEEYNSKPKENTILSFEWIYYNTATSKTIVNIIKSLKKVKLNGGKLSILWNCKTSDELMIEKGEELKEILDVDFSIIIIP